MQKHSKVLIVDDEPELVWTMIALLTRHGYLVESAATGLRALEVAREVTFDIILLDIELPDFDGFMVCLALRKLHITRATPIIFTSGTPSHEYVTRSRELGGVDFIAKPFDATVLLRAIDHHVKRTASLPTVA